MANILVLDDSKNLLQMLKEVLQLHNYEVRTALTRSSLLAHMEIFKPDIILMDIFLEGSNGKQICKELKEENSTKHIPVILVSGNHEQLRDYKQYLADDIIEKPFEYEDVERKIEAALKKKKLARLV
jgi:DNA-binding response OmpR family regulator